MKTVLYHVFKKNLVLVLAAFLLLGVSKYMAVSKLEQPAYDEQLLDGWLEQVSVMDEEEAKAYFSALQAQITEENTDENGFVNIEDSVREALSSLDDAITNRTNVEWMIAFAENGVGMLPRGIRNDYLELRDFYRQLSQPSLTDPTEVEHYLKLQKNSVVCILAVFLTAVFLGTHYEAEIYRYTSTTRNGRAYHSMLRCTLLSLSLLLLVCNELADLLCSGLLTSPEVLQASIQSCELFWLVPMNVTVGQTLWLMFLSKVCSVVFLYFATEKLAIWRKNLKDTLVSAVGLMAVLSFLASSLGSTWVGSYLQVMNNNWEDILAEMSRYPQLNVTSFTLGLVLTVILAAVSVLLVLVPEKQRKTA